MRKVVLATLAAFVLLGSASVHANSRIAAHEVVDRPTLKGFVQSAKAYMENMRTVTEIARLRDVFRDEEGPWKSDDLYLITMVRNGTVLTHGHDPTADNKDLFDVEDEHGRPVVQSILAAAERGGDFVDYRWDGADRVAYATKFTSGLTGETLIIVAGFSQDLSSVPVEIEPLPRPEVTAAEVVDRETLVTFVKAASKVYRDAVMTPGLKDLPNTKNALRQEGGDWKSGDVYVFVISTDGYTLFHGAQPIRFEGQKFEDIERQDIHGVHYLRELLAAGEAGGGFVEYMFDNPAIEGDEETGSPKVAYATGFTLPGRDQVYVVVSGFYPDP